MTLRQSPLRLLTDVSPPTLRPYQVQAFDAVTSDWAEGTEKLLVVLPTGSGKSVFAGSVIRQEIENGGRVLTLAHTKKLVRQFHNSLVNLYGIDSAVEMANEKAHHDAPSVCASIQTINNRIDEKTFDRGCFTMIVIDEAHRALSQTYTKITNYLKAEKILGLTATPRRGDQRDLMQFFDKVSIDLPLNKLVDDGWLCRLKIHNIPVKIDLSGVSSKAGDYDAAELGHVLAPYLKSCAHELAKHKGRRALVFLPLIELSKWFSDLCADAGMNVVHVDGLSGEKMVNETIRQLTDGEIDGITNSMLLTEGVDIPLCDLVMNLRPTKSWTLFTQIIGRGTRGGRLSQWPEKTECVVLDPLWLCDEHSLLQRPPDLLARTEEESKEIQEKLLESDGDLMAAVNNAGQDRAKKLKERLEKNRHRDSRVIDAMEFFLSIGDIDLANYEPMSEWERMDLTPAQKNVLVRNKIDLRTITGRGHAGKVIQAIVDRIKAGKSSIGQAQYAKFLGMENPWEKSFNEVSDFIGGKKQQEKDKEIPW